MPFSQDVQGCLELRIGALGLSQSSLRRNLDALKPRIESLRAAYRDETLPLLRVPERTDDIGPAREALANLSRGAKLIVFFGTGGSSLGGQTLAQLGGWNIPGDEGDGASRPRIRFYDNLDPRTLERALAGFDLAATRFVVTSKSGNTPETLVQAIASLDAVRKAGLEKRIPELFLGLTEEATPEASNGLRLLCETFGIPTLPHDPGIGGRFSGLTNVGLLPALARGLDVEALRDGARDVVSTLLTEDDPAGIPAAIGAGIAVGLAKEKSARASVMLPYSDRLARFAAWYVQLWGESLGKEGQGTTPVAALGPVDQHSQLQLYLDGTPQHFITVIRTQCGGAGPRVDRHYATLVGADYLANRSIGDLVAAQQQAIPEVLIKAGRPVRTLDVETLDERSLGGLMMHFMLETILAGHLLGVDPFDQPAVESGKVLTRRYLSG